MLSYLSLILEICKCCGSYSIIDATFTDSIGCARFTGALELYVMFDDG